VPLIVRSARSASATSYGAPPRALFRLGSHHAGRGLSAINQFDVGNLAAELAASNGSTSLHVLVLGAGGHVNRSLPVLADRALRSAPYAAREELEQIGAVPFIGGANAPGRVVCDLAPLRRTPAARAAGGALFERLVFAYDCVVLVPEAHAATDFVTG
jgi:hypothetical protein